MDESTSADIPQQGADSSETIANETPALTETETDLESGDATTEVEGTEVPKTDIEPTATATPLDEGDQASSSSNIEQTRLEAEIPTAGLPDPEVENWAKIFLRIHREETAERDTEITRLKTELEATQNSLTKAEEAIAQWTQDEERYKAQLKDYPGALSDDDPDALIQTIAVIWESCFSVVQNAMQQDLTEEAGVLAVWSVHYWPDLEEKVPNIVAVPFEASNNPLEKRLRVMFVMALVAQSLDEYILTPNYLLEDDDDLRFLLKSIKNKEKKNLLRRVLFSIADEENQRDTACAVRVAVAVKGVIDVLQPLLPVEMLEALKADLAKVLSDAAAAWEPLQRCESHYEVSTRVARAPWDWESIQPGEDENEKGVMKFKLTTAPSSTFEQDEVLMVVFPRVCSIDRSKTPSVTPIFPGVVFQRSQVQAMGEAGSKEEEGEVVAAAPDSSVAEPKPETEFEVESLPLPQLEPPLPPQALEVVGEVVPGKDAEKPELSPVEPGSETTANTDDESGDGDESTEGTEDEDEDEEEEEAGDTDEKKKE